jgi:hypothetical protein
MKTDNDPRTTAELQAEATRRMEGLTQYLVEDLGERSVSMTAATEAIHGTSGRGNPRAVRQIECLAQYGYVTITGKHKRTVKLTAKGLACGPVDRNVTSPVAG